MQNLGLKSYNLKCLKKKKKKNDIRMQLFGKFIDVNVKRTVTIEPPVMQNTSLLKDLFPY